MSCKRSLSAFARTGVLEAATMMLSMSSSVVLLEPPPSSPSCAHVSSGHNAYRLAPACACAWKERQGSHHTMSHTDFHINRGGADLHFTHCVCASAPLLVQAPRTGRSSLRCCCPG